MANSVKNSPASGTEHHFFDATTATPALNEPGFLGAATDGKVGSHVFQVVGTGFTGSLKPQGLVPGSGTWKELALENLSNDDTNRLIAAGTGATGDGIYSVRADHGLLIRLATTVSAGSVDVYVRKGVG